jgi:hypothetical protein
MLHHAITTPPLPWAAPAKGVHLIFAVGFAADELLAGCFHTTVPRAPRPFARVFWRRLH